MAKSKEQTPSPSVEQQLAEIRTQRIALAKEQITAAAAEVAKAGSLSDAAALALASNLELAEQTEADFTRLVRTLRQVPIWARIVEEHDPATLYHTVAKAEAELAELVAAHRRVEVQKAEALDTLRRQHLSASTAEDSLRIIRARFPNVIV